MPSTDFPTLLSAKAVEDSRGLFAKPLAADVREQLGFDIVELFWTTSPRACVRGMHFQTPPWAVRKLVWVSVGRVVDVVVDLRPGPDFGRHHVFEMAAGASEVLYVPAGFAHGFQGIDESSIVNYAVDQPYVPEHDEGIRWDSLGVDWPLPAGLISDRDLAFPALSEWESPFPPVG